MSKIVKILIFAALLAPLSSGCSLLCPDPSHKEVFIRDTTYVFSPAPIIDSSKATSVTDTIIQIIRTLQKDTLVDIRYYPVRTEFYWRIQPDTVRITARDTLINYQDNVQIETTPFWLKLVIFVAGFLTAAIVILVILKLTKSKI